MSDLNVGTAPPPSYDPREPVGAARQERAVQGVAAGVPAAAVPMDAIVSAAPVRPGSAAVASDGRPLPEVGAQASAQQTRSAVQKGINWAGGTYNLAAALSLLVETAAQRAEGASRSQQLQNRAATNVSMQKAEEVNKEVQAQRESAISSFVTSVVASAASIGVGAAGGFMSTATAKMPAALAQGASAAEAQAHSAAVTAAMATAARSQVWGSTLMASGSSVGTLVNSSGQMTDKLAGGGYAEGQAKIAQSNLDVLLQIFKNNDESLKNETQEANRSWSQLLEMRDKVIDRQNSVMISSAQF